MENINILKIHQYLSDQTFHEAVEMGGYEDTPLFRTLLLFVGANSDVGVDLLPNFFLRHIHLYKHINLDLLLKGSYADALKSYLCLQDLEPAAQLYFTQIYSIMCAACIVDDEAIAEELKLILVNCVKRQSKNLVNHVKRQTKDLKLYKTAGLKPNPPKKYIELLKTAVFNTRGLTAKAKDSNFYSSAEFLHLLGDIYSRWVDVYMMTVIATLSNSTLDTVIVNMRNPTTPTIVKNECTPLTSLETILDDYIPKKIRQKSNDTLNSYVTLYHAMNSDISTRELEKLNLQSDIKQKNKTIKNLTTELDSSKATSKSYAMRIKQLTDEIASFKKRSKDDTLETALRTLQTRYNNIQVVLDDTRNKLHAREGELTKLATKIEYLETYKERVQIMEEYTEDDTDDFDNRDEKLLSLQNYRIVLVTTVPDWGTRFENFLVSNSIACRVVKDGIMPTLYDTDLVVINVLGIPHSYYYKLKQQLNGTLAKVLCVPNFNFDKYLSLMYRKVTTK